jgi:hypothetical protein
MMLLRAYRDRYGRLDVQAIGQQSVSRSETTKDIESQSRHEPIL